MVLADQVGSSDGIVDSTSMAQLSTVLEKECIKHCKFTGTCLEYTATMPLLAYVSLMQKHVQKAWLVLE